MCLIYYELLRQSDYILFLLLYRFISPSLSISTLLVILIENAQLLPFIALLGRHLCACVQGWLTQPRSKKYRK